MRYRQLISVLTASGALFFFLFGLVQLVALYLPGGDDLVPLSVVPGGKYDYPHQESILAAARLSAVFLLMLAPTSFLGGVAWLAARSDRRRPPGAEQPLVPEPWPRIVLVAAVCLGGLAFSWGVLISAVQLWMEELPMLGAPTTASSITFGLGLCWSSAAAFIVLAWGMVRALHANRPAGATGER